MLISTDSVNATTARIAVLGDSLVQGYGLHPDEGLVPQLEAWLVEKGVNAALINAGVSGDTTAGGLARLDWTLSDDVDALIVSLGANDALRGIDPSVSLSNLGAILQEANARHIPILLIGIAAPGNYGPDYASEFNAMFPTLSKTFGTLLYPDILQPLTELPDRTATLAQYFQPDGLHPNVDGVKLITNAIGPYVAELAKLAAQSASSPESNH